MWNIWNGMYQAASMWKNALGWMWGVSQTPAPAPAPEPKPEQQQPEQQRMSQYEKYMKVCERIVADMPVYDLNTSNLSAALAAGKGNCCAISTYSKIACGLLGIENDIIFATNNPYIPTDIHLWNRVTLDGKKYWSDITMVQMGRADGWGQDQKAFDYLSDLQKRYNTVYVIHPDGTVQMLSDLSLTAGTKPGMCVAATLTAAIIKSEYAANYEYVGRALQEIGV